MANSDYIFGSISSGTLRTEDLIPTFIDVLDELQKGTTPLTKRIAYEIDEHPEQYFASEESDFDLEELYDLLQEYAPPYGYFGAHPGDGADFGFWLCEDVEQMVLDMGGKIVSDLAEINVDKIREAGEWPESGHIEVLHVNDHGNLTLYDYDLSKNIWTEICAVV